MAPYNYTGSALADTDTFVTIDDLHNIYLNPRVDHWCFLGEITSVENLTRIVLRVNDRDAQGCIIAFYDSQRGRGFEGLQVGRTVCVIDPPLIHRFLDGRFGVRVEDDMVKRIKILDAPLKAILDASDTICQRNRLKRQNPDSPTKCDECKKDMPSELRCGGCKVFHFCGTDCQAKAWPTHMKVCKAFKSAEFLMTRNWEFRGPIDGFPPKVPEGGYMIDN